MQAHKVRRDAAVVAGSLRQHDAPAHIRRRNALGLCQQRQRALKGGVVNLASALHIHLITAMLLGWCLTHLENPKSPANSHREAAGSTCLNCGAVDLAHILLIPESSKEIWTKIAAETGAAVVQCCTAALEPLRCSLNAHSLSRWPTLPRTREKMRSIAVVVRRLSTRPLSRHIFTKPLPSSSHTWSTPDLGVPLPKLANALNAAASSSSDPRSHPSCIRKRKPDQSCKEHMRIGSGQAWEECPCDGLRAKVLWTSIGKLEMHG